MDDAKVQELSDVREIIDVMNQYTTALDTRNWEMLEATMTPDGQADFGNLAGVGILDSPQALVELCRKSLQDLRATQHLQGNYAVEVNGDTAQASCYLQANHFQEGLPGRRRRSSCGPSTATTSSAPRTAGRSRSATSTRSRPAGT